jgi:hypothetical protein
VVPLETAAAEGEFELELVVGAVPLDIVEAVGVLLGATAPAEGAVEVDELY